MLDVRSLLAVDWGANGVMMKASVINHDTVKCGVFLGPPFDAREIVRHYYGTLVDSNLSTQKQFQNLYGNYIISVIVYSFTVCAFKFVETVLDWKGDVRSA